MLFSRHALGVQTIYSDVKRRAGEQLQVLLGTPGSVSVREVDGRPFVYRQYYGPSGKKLADYLGPRDDAATRDKEAATRESIDTTNALLADARVLAHAGYVRVDSRTNALLAPFVNRGFFRSGGVLVGSHAWGALLNDLGVKAAAYHTEDVDLARPRRLELEASLDALLAETMLNPSPIMGFDRTRAPTAFKTPGRDGIRLDVLAPTTRREPTVVAVPELHAHALGLPYLGYLLEESIDAVVLGRESVLSVRVPRAEQFACHKMIVAPLRAHTSEKRPKDLHQAAVLIAALAESDAPALEDALRDVPRSARSHFKKSLEWVKTLLTKEHHDTAVDLLGSAAG